MRLRRDHCELKADGSETNKYLMLPSKKSLRRGLYLLPVDRKRLMKASVAERKKLRIVLVEAEKSVLAATAWARSAQRRDLIFAATGGCDSCNTPDLELLRGAKVDVLLDSNVWTSERPKKVEPIIVNLLRLDYKADAGVLRLPRESLDHGINGPDDFIAAKKNFGRLIDGPRAEPWLDFVGVSWDEYSNAQPPPMAIKDFLQDECTTLLGGLPSAMKTWVLMEIVRALLTGTPLFNHFPTPKKVDRVIYLTPEVSLSWAKQRFEKMGLGKYIKNRQLILRTLSQSRIELTNPNLLLAAHGAYVFLDTVVRFIKGAENENKDNDTGLAHGCFTLLGAGARAVIGAHHATKASRDANEMTLENMFRGAGDISAFVRTAYGAKKISSPDDTTRAPVVVACLKPGDFDPPLPFVLEGKPHIDDGEGLRMVGKPGVEAARLKSKKGRPATENQDEKVLWMMRHISDEAKKGKRPTVAVLTERMNKTFKSGHSRDTVAKWIKGYNDEQKQIKKMAEKETK